MLMVNVDRFILIDCCDWTAAKWRRRLRDFTKLAPQAATGASSERGLRLMMRETSEKEHYILYINKKKG